jgi:RNA polymerase sigma factor (sigma-70 family)
VTPDPEPPGESRTAEIARLLLRARAGDRRALDEIVDRLMPLVWNVARAQGLDVESASDVVQKTWVKLLEDLDKIRTPEALASWLIVVTRREAWRLRRRGRRGEELVAPDLLAELTAPVVDAGTTIVLDERDRCLWRNIRKLPPRCQELLRVIAFVDRPDYAGLAETLDMPKGSIGPTRGRCLDKLRKLLADDPRWSQP